MARILIADDHILVREGLKRLFSLDARLTVVMEAGTGTDALQAVQQGGIDVVVLDLNMPGVDGTGLIAQIRARFPKLPILVLSMHNEAQIVKNVIKAGANGYVAKDAAPETLLAAVNCVAKGNRYIDPVIAENMLFNFDVLPNFHKKSDDVVPHETLSEREFLVMRMLSTGYSVNEIAAKLAISNKTVSTYKARLKQKLACGSDAELVRYALIHGLA